MAGKIIIDTERCKGCGLCVATCPKKIIVISEESNRHGYFPAETDNRNCTGCTACAVICPDAVIEVGNMQLNPISLTQAVQDMQQAEGIGAARDADHHYPTPSQETISVNGLADFQQDIHYSTLYTVSPRRTFSSTLRPIS